MTNTITNTGEMMVNKQKNKQTKKKLPARMELDGERPVRQAKKEVNFGTSGKL